MSTTDMDALREMMEKHTSDTILLAMSRIYKEKAAECRLKGQQPAAMDCEANAENLSYVRNVIRWY